MAPPRMDDRQPLTAPTGGSQPRPKYALRGKGLWLVLAVIIALIAWLYEDVGFYLWAMAPARPALIPTVGSRPPRESTTALRTAAIPAEPPRDATSRVPQPTSSKGPTLQERIATFYDRTSRLWEEEWGEHMHHGFYPIGVPVRSHAENIAAQERMVDEVLAYGGADALKGPLRILDAGCGIGGSARYLARKFPGARVTGITLSPYQHQRAVALTKAEGLDDRVDFLVQDAMHTAFPDNTFDLVYSMESGEHMPDKRGFVQECHRVLKPGAPIVMAVWCHRETPPDLDASEQRLLQKIYKVYALPYVCPLSDFTVFAKDLSMTAVRHDDWTKFIKPFWWQVIKRALTPSGIWGIIKSGWTALHAAWAAWWMHVAVERDVFVFGAFTAAKRAL